MEEAGGGGGRGTKAKGCETKRLGAKILLEKELTCSGVAEWEREVVPRLMGVFEVSTFARVWPFPAGAW